MGCLHDNEVDSPCSSKNTDGSFYVMAPFVHMDTNIWSPCSKKFITEYFEYESRLEPKVFNFNNTFPFSSRNQLGECLTDEPQEAVYKEIDMLPGAVYDADFQCNLLFPGIGSKVCSLEERNFCQSLFCKTGPDTCASNGEPPADGTKCGNNKVWSFIFEMRKYKYFFPVVL